MSKQVGLDMKLYRNTGTNGSPVWNLIPNVRDLQGPDSMKEAEVSIRGSQIVLTEPTLREFSADWEMIYDPDDPDFVALQTAYAAKTLVEFAFADALMGGGTHYFRIECKVFKFERSEPLEGANTYAVTIKPCYSANAPQYV